MSSDPSAPERQRNQQERPTWPAFAIFGALWLVVCAFAFELMMGWL